MNGAKILIVDDQPFFRQAVRVRLQREGFICSEATNAREALDKVNAEGFELVLTDLVMPDRNGYLFCGDLLSLPHPPAIGVVTMVDDERLRSNLLGRGVAGYFVKPVDFESLREWVSSVVTDRLSRCTEVADEVGASPVPDANTEERDATMSIDVTKDQPDNSDAVAAETNLSPTVVGAANLGEAILWPTILFATGTGFGWALHLISSSFLLQR